MDKSAIWTTNTGEQLKIIDMTDSHLVNAINMLRCFVMKNWRSIRHRDFEAASGTYCMVLAEMASYYAGRDMDMALEDLETPIDVDEWLEENVPQYRKMLWHAKRRGLEEKLISTEIEQTA